MYKRQPIIRLVNQIIAEAVKKRASDIHVEPMERKVRLRYRVDGDCIEQEPIPKKLQPALISRLKIMAKMKPEEKRMTQDGRIKLRLGGRDIDFRVNALPASHGESIVLRILDKEKALVDLELLGLYSVDFEKFNRIIKRPNGIFLVTGPTGSGKTTTLYAALKKLNKPETRGMRNGWYADVEGLTTLIRVLPPELYDKVVSGKGEVAPGASVPGSGSGKASSGHEGHGGMKTDLPAKGHEGMKMDPKKGPSPKKDEHEGHKK